MGGAGKPLGPMNYTKRPPRRAGTIRGLLGIPGYRGACPTPRPPDLFGTAALQTPQVIKPSLLLEGFAKVEELGLEVTDDVSIIEQMGLPVKLTLGEYTNLKLTTPEDMEVAAQILKSRAA